VGPHERVRSSEEPVSATGAGVEATLAQDAATLALGGAAPDAVVDPVPKRVLEARALHWTRRTHLPSNVHADAVTGKETRGGLVPAVALGHPLCVHLHHLFSF